LRSFARALGAAREADVRRDLLLAMAAGDESLRPAERARLEGLLDDLCADARERLRRRLAEPGWEALRVALQRHAASESLLASRDAGLAQVLDLAERSWKRPARHLEEPPDDAVELHELRLALKHCRYALEPLSDVAPTATAQLVRRLRSAQDTLGEHRDVLLASHWVRLNERRLGRRLTTRLAGLLDQREQRLRAAAFRRIRKLRPALADWRKATRRLRGGKTARRA
jgi:CHAD domain-containing protein